MHVEIMKMMCTLNGTLHERNAMFLWFQKRLKYIQFYRQLSSFSVTHSNFHNPDLSKTVKYVVIVE